MLLNDEKTLSNEHKYARANFAASVPSTTHPTEMITALLTSLALGSLAAADTCPARFLLHPNGDPDACLHVDTITDGAKASM